MTTHTEMYGDDQLLQELFSNPSFIQLTAQEGLVDETQWLSWFDKYPRFQEVSLIARKLYELKYFESTTSVTEGYRSEVWEGIVAHLDSHPDKAARRGLGGIKIQQWLQYAAILIAACAFGLWIYLAQTTKVFGESYATSTSKQEFTLPDGSKLWLNKYSTANYQEDASGRRLDLRGEGYLHVTKQINNGKKRPFIVEHDGLKVEVLGTRFNIINTAKTKLVALDEGRVRAAYEGRDMLMKPGDVVNVDRGVLKRLPIQSDLVNSWQTGVLDLNKTSLNEILIWLQFTYRMNIVSKLPSDVMSSTVSGQIDLSDRQNVLKSLGNLYHIRISEQKDHFEISTLK